jgi:hypothetical protein
MQGQQLELGSAFKIFANLSFVGQALMIGHQPVKQQVIPRHRNPIGLSCSFKSINGSSPNSNFTIHSIQRYFREPS